MQRATSNEILVIYATEKCCSLLTQCLFCKSFVLPRNEMLLSSLQNLFRLRKKQLKLQDSSTLHNSSTSASNSSHHVLNCIAVQSMCPPESSFTDVEGDSVEWLVPCRHSKSYTQFESFEIGQIIYGNLQITTCTRSALSLQDCRKATTSFWNEMWYNMHTHRLLNTLQQFVPNPCIGAQHNISLTRVLRHDIFQFLIHHRRWGSRRQWHSQTLLIYLLNAHVRPWQLALQGNSVYPPYDLQQVHCSVVKAVGNPLKHSRKLHESSHHTYTPSKLHYLN